MFSLLIKYEPWIARSGTGAKSNQKATDFCPNNSATIASMNTVLPVRLVLLHAGQQLDKHLLYWSVFYWYEEIP